MSGRVIVVGSVNVDLVVNVARLPAPGETVTGGSFSRHHGGKGGNQAVAAALLGAPTVFVGAVGSDAFGDEARSALAEGGVSVSSLAVIDAQPTGVALILVDQAGENLIAVASGANGALAPDAVTTELDRLGLGSDDVVLVGHEIPTASARAALVAARARGARSILNPAPAGGLDRSTFALADILTPNRTELRQLVDAETRRTGRGPSAVGTVEAAARSLLEPSAEGDGIATAVLVTLGRAGALLVSRVGAALDLPPPSVVAVDTVGAGDALNGALAAALAEGRTLEEAARRGVLAGSLATTRLGAREAMPTPEALEAAGSGDRRQG